MLSAVESLFSQALGLGVPWQVEKISFSVEEIRIDIHLNFSRGSKFICLVYGRKDVKDAIIPFACRIYEQLSILRTYP